MKKFYWLCLGILGSCLLGGCEQQHFGENLSFESEQKNTFLQAQEEKTSLIIKDNTISERFFAYLQTFTLDTLPQAYPEVQLPKDIHIPLRILKIVPSQLSEYQEGDIQNEQQDSVFLVYFYQEKFVAIQQEFADQEKYLQFGVTNDSGRNDVYFLGGTGQKNLYKNFNTLLFTGVFDRMLHPKTHDIYVMKHDIIDEDTYKTSLWRNREMFNSWGGIDRTIFFLGFDKQGKILYPIRGCKDGEIGENEEFQFSFCIKNEDGEIFDHRKYSGLYTNYYFIRYPDNRFTMGRRYSEGPFAEKESPTLIQNHTLQKVFNQKKLIFKRVRLLDQKKYREAYNLLINPEMSLSDFTTFRNEYQLVSVSRIRNEKLYFREYKDGKLISPSEEISNNNEFMVSLFLQKKDESLLGIEMHLQVKDKNIQMVSQSFYSEENYPKIMLSKLYYHRIATQRFEEAYHMQYSHNQSLEQFITNYQNILGIEIKDERSPDWDIEGPNYQLIIDFIDENSYERYLIEKELIGEQLKHISSQNYEFPCFDCTFY